MSHKPIRRCRPILQALEGRDVPSGLGVMSSGVAAQVAILPYIEQENVVRFAVAPERVPPAGGPSGIIAILIGL